MSQKESVKYSRKEFTATLDLIAVNGTACHIGDQKMVEGMKDTFFKHFSTQPTKIYRVIDTTGGNAIFRGFVFLTANGWGCAVRLKENSFYIPFTHPETYWGAIDICATRSEATARTIRQSRGHQEKENQKETPKPKVQHPVSSSSRDYQLLELPKTFTVSQLKKAYRQLCFKHHPDTGDGNRQKLESVISAYKRLKTKVQ